MSSATLEHAPREGTWMRGLPARRRLLHPYPSCREGRGHGGCALDVTTEQKPAGNRSRDQSAASKPQS